MATERAPHCPHCAHFHISYTSPMPLSCTLWGIGTVMGKMPSHAVFESTAAHCQYFREKNSRQSGEHTPIKRPDPETNIDLRI